MFTETGFDSCDIKPKNFLVFKEGEKQTVKITDFGFTSHKTDVSSKRHIPSVATSLRLRCCPVDLSPRLPKLSVCTLVVDHAFVGYAS